jgi:gentisate 1,2-dioxygenase
MVMAQPEPVAPGGSEERWERWQKRRVFVREVAGRYSEVYRELYQQPRVIRSGDVPFKGGPSVFSKNIVNPQALRITQAIEAHIEVLAPGNHGQKHGHMNSAVFYILEGRGHDVHDGRRWDWEAGDALVVENACVHQHFNDLPDREARILVLKAKPMFNFFNLLFQRTVELPPDTAAPGFEDWRPQD